MEFAITVPTQKEEEEIDDELMGWVKEAAAFAAAK